MAGLISMIADIETEVEDRYSDMIEKIENSVEDYMESREPFLDRRRELVSGSSEPTDAELEGFKEQVGVSELKAATANPGVPFFWLTALSCQDLVAEQITPRDRAALQYLQDVRWTKGPMGFFLEFFFDENPFFYNKVLRRGFVVISDDESGLIHTFHEEFTMVDWREGQRLTVKPVVGRKKVQKGKKGKQSSKADAAGEGEGEEEGEEEVRQKPCPSFFKFFAAVKIAADSAAAAANGGHLDEDDADVDEDDAAVGEGEMTERQMAKRDKDLALIAAIRDFVIPKAGHLYMEGMKQDPSSGVQGSSDTEDDGGFTLVSGRPSTMEALPVASQQAVHAVMAVQRQLDALLDAVKALERSERKAAYEFALQQYAKRREVIVRDGSEEEGADAPEPAVPRFWLRALKGLDSAVPYIHRKDERVLQHLVDVRWMRQLDEEGEEEDRSRIKVTVEWEFEANPYFKGTLLSKRYELVESEDPSDLPVLLLAEAEAVQWEEGQDPTTKAGPTGRLQPAASFFNLFKQGATRYAFNLVGEGKEVEREALDLEAELLMDIRRGLVPDASSLYIKTMSEGLDDDVDDESEEDEEEGGADDEGEEGAEGEVSAAKRASSKIGGKKKGSWLNGASWLLVLLAFVIVAEMFVFLDQMRGRR